MKLRINSLRALIVILILTPFFRGIAKDLLFSLAVVTSTLLLIEYFRKINYKVSINRKKISGRIFINATLIVVYTLINIIINGVSVGVIERLLQLYVCFSILIVVSEYNWNKEDYRFCIRLIKCVIIACIVLWPLSGFKTNYYGGLFTRGNALGGALFCYMAIYLAVPRKLSIIDKIFICLILFLMYIANSRSSLLSLSIFILIRYVWLKNKSLNLRSIFVIAVITFTIFPYIYMLLYESNIRDVLDNFSWMYFRKRFFSGRQYLWGTLIDYIKSRFAFGYGLDITPEILLGGEWSSHNWYIQVLLQMGIVGYLLLINILRIVWNALNNLKMEPSSVNSSAFIVGVLVWQCFEVTITQNNFSVGVLVWLVMAMGINTNIIDFENEEESIKLDNELLI